MPEAFKEDFFERVVNVKWETEPKRLWMAAAGNPLFVNGIYNAWNAFTYIWSSDNGHDWEATDYGLHSGAAPNRYAVGPIFGGGWLRKNLDPKQDPVWFFVGGDGRFQPGAMSVNSLDGVYLHPPETNWDDHAIGVAVGPTANGVYALMQRTLPLDPRLYPFTSSDGIGWEPPNYFGGVSPLSGGASTMESLLPAGTEITGPHGSIVAFITTPEPERTLQIMQKAAHDPLPAQFAVPAPEPFSSSPSKPIVFVQGTSIQATGKVQKGVLKNIKSLTAIIDPYNFNAPAHGGPVLSIYDTSDPSKVRKLTVSNCGISRTITISYGYYTWLVGGADSRDHSIIAYSQDLLKWRRIDLGPNHQVNCIIAGPYKGAKDPTGPTGANPNPAMASGPMAGPTGLSIP